ncbi:hypothetical protein UFOVP466_79 [uncultured Caudovirales phage]|uniref:Uncharacterized protein n=1 Tax=uncultured Caudovirales phage TaxID=2100421 RepID=A0A6J5R198_9CAUD|nr:hypothetical protein UFOVP466_79 [uncultured Caudovirales phage]CAB4180423.1 hypothetical protein UFOVP1045_26 [uncultured Caudovirales phage]CAB4190629.1 hypothetical protein UFOVP1194_80 [uncultured Caudovirales phage]CAB4221839.1 hypothetical protein UFOVP1641_76 [uncultured Caudovirales phage]
MAVDHTTEYLVWDDVEAGSVVLKRNAGNTTVSIGVMLREELTSADGTIEGVGVDAKAIRFVVPNILLNPTALGRVIKRNDVIVGADTISYQVLSVDKVFAGAEWTCVTTPER